MNSRQSRFIWQNFILYGVFALFAPFSVADGSHQEPSEIHLSDVIEKKILERWLSIEQRDSSQVNVIIRGLPSEYRAPNKCLDVLKVKPVKELRIGNNSIEVSCKLKRTWSLILTADIEVWQKVVVLRNHIARGETLTNHHLSLQLRNIADLSRGYFSLISDVQGNISKRSLRSGSAINQTMITKPIILKRGQAVTLRVNRPGLSVNMKGIALKKGREGDIIKVKNSSSEKILYGKILSSDLVLID